MLIRLRKAQGVTEYAIFIAAVLAGFVALQIYFQRAVKGNLKERANSVGEQFTTTEDYTIQTASQTDRDSLTGYQVDNWGNTYWNKSVIQHDLGQTGMGGGTFESDLVNAGAKMLEQDSYAHHEIQKKDYVTSAQGSGQMGVHSVFDGGQIAQKDIWQEAGR